ncbi:HAMP domain-containing histidine kinase [Ochrobactrum sp. XJ1]|nr:HAMP domain-containing histidine kinase [Ochrobactrum sp. XJ1]
MKWTRSLQGRLTAAMLLVFLLGAADVGIYLFDLDDDFRAHILDKQVDTILAGQPVAKAQDLRLLPTRFSEADWRYALYAEDGRLLGSMPVDGSPVRFLRAGDERIDSRSAELAREISPGNILVIAKDDILERGEVGELVSRNLAGSFLLMLILGAVSLTAMYMLARWTLRSVGHAAALAETIGVENTERRIPLEGLPLEVTPLALAANTALDRLATAYSIERRVTADAAHELRTPLAILTLRLQQAKMSEKVNWESIEREMRQMKRLIDQLMTLTRAEAPQGYTNARHPVSVSRVVRLAAADMMLLFEAAGRKLEVDTDAERYTQGDEAQLRQAVHSLLENALIHGAGTVSVRLRAPSPEIMTVDIMDEGKSPERQEAQDWFKRFRKGRQGGPGAGLGLSIVAQIARNMGGSVAILDTPSFTIRMCLPPDGVALPPKSVR